MLSKILYNNKKIRSSIVEDIMSKMYQRKKIKKIILLIIVLLAFFAFTALIFTYLIKSFKNLNFFRVTKISIVADEKLEKEKILKNSGIKIGDNIFAVDINKIAEQILNDPWVKNVKIIRTYPKKIIIDAKIKDICGIAKQNKKLVFVDCYGKLIDKFKPEINKEFIVFESYNNEYLPILNLLQKLKLINNEKYFKLQNISEIYLAEDNYFILKLQERKEAIHLTLKNLEEKLIQVGKVLNDLDSRNETASKIDATMGANKIVVKKIN